jgi:lysophospholipase L1-like esterase
MKRTLALVLALCIYSLSFAQIKIACIGNSITYGYGYDDPRSYPSQLDSMLGDGWEVKNFGVPGATMLRKGDYPYHKLEAYANAKAFNPDVIIIKLGTNDTKPQNWDSHSAEFMSDYDSMLTELKALPSKPYIILCTPVPAYSHGYGIRDSIVKLEIPLVTKLASNEKLKLIDLYTLMSDHSEWFPDGIHPNEYGLKEMASVIAGNIKKWKKEIEKR